MHIFWLMLLLVLGALPLLVHFFSRGSKDDFWHKSAIEAVVQIVPRKFRFVAGVLYLALLMFALLKVKGLL